MPTSLRCLTIGARDGELLTVLPNEVLAQLRERQRHRELDALALVELRLRYQHLLRRRK
jgi:hypothetical protein